VNLLAKPITDVQTAADFSSIMSMMREPRRHAGSRCRPTVLPVQTPPVTMLAG
jgi:hypothetical protein